MENLSTRITYIYGLYEVGKEDEIRYVGKSDNPRKRFNNHIKQMKYEKNTYKNNWINSVYNRNSKVEMVILEIVDYNIWQEKEIYWISKMKRIGNKLTNLTIGGDGTPGYYTYDISYNECKKYLLENENIKSKSSFYNWIKSDKYNKKIPRNPREVFILRNEWVSWGDFLSTYKVQDNQIKNIYISYNDAKNWIKNNLKSGLTSVLYKQYVKENIIPDFIPNRPDRFYHKRGWISWSDFLDNENIIQNQKREFVSYDECKKYARDNNVKSLSSWIKIKKPINIPSVPPSCYKEWVSWSDFLGVEIISDQDKSKMYMSYDECKKFIYENLDKINSKSQLRSHILKNNIKNIPLNPELSYKNKGWVSWDSFLSKEYLNFKDAKEVVKKLNIKSNKEWRIFIKNKDKIYKNIPNSPDKFYKSEWIDWYDWLGNKKKCK